MTAIPTNSLSNILGGAGRATPPASTSAASSAGSLNPFTYWTNVWTNVLTAPMVYAPPFSTTPLFPTPFH
jgi:hypothetical protein